MENVIQKKDLHFELAASTTRIFAYMCKDANNLNCGLNGELVAYPSCHSCLHSVNRYGVNALNPTAKIYCRE